MKKILNLTLFLLIIVSIPLFSSDFIETSLDDYIYVGSVNKFEKDEPQYKDLKFYGYTDALLVAFDKNGNEKDTIIIGGKEEDYFTDVTEFNGNVYALGSVWNTTFGTGDFKNLKNRGKRDCFIVKFNENYKIEKIINFGSNQYNFGNDIKTDKDGNVYVVGRIYSEDNTQSAFIVKFDKDLNKKGFVKFKGEFNNKVASYTRFNALTFSDNEELIICGDVCGENDFDISKGLICKFDKELKCIDKSYYEKDALTFELSDIDNTKDGFLCVGLVVLEQGYANGVVLKINNDLSMNYIKIYSPLPPKDSKYPTYASFNKVKKDKIFGLSGLYMGNGDYDDDTVHYYSFDYKENELKTNNENILPKFLKSWTVNDFGNEKIVCVEKGIFCVK